MWMTAILVKTEAYRIAEMILQHPAADDEALLHDFLHTCNLWDNQQLSNKHTLLLIIAVVTMHMLMLQQSSSFWPIALWLETVRDSYCTFFMLGWSALPEILNKLLSDYFTAQLQKGLFSHDLKRLSWDKILRTAQNEASVSSCKHQRHMHCVHRLFWSFGIFFMARSVMHWECQCVMDTAFLLPVHQWYSQMPKVFTVL